MLQIVKVEQDDELREFDPDAFLEARPKPIKSKQTKLKFSPQCPRCHLDSKKGIVKRKYGTKWKYRKCSNKRPAYNKRPASN